ncbi:uncharacterized protein ALTATR162_LOCUS3322 [Alternaria atra]|uniref:Uncharacterized protein n=1 Tax=Alternaria atra TaxID=119953 RepID=A0A8J2HZZ8_9PLEO|nr:uncharacterized protein ALTATR162_LOCUS3322 [Alternaria atra]CAG5153771.1 unnamed protein product [Alternaria atra]
MSLAVCRTQGMGAFRFALIISFETTVCLCPEYENGSGVIAYSNDEISVILSLTTSQESAKTRTNLSLHHDTEVRYRECERWSLLSISRDIPTSSRAISAEPSLALSAALHITHEVRNSAIFRKSQS